MKPKLRDYLSVLMAFAAVFLCGYGVGVLIGERRAAPPDPPPEDRWVQEILPGLRDSLALRPEQVELVEGELEQTAEEIGKSREGALLEYHRHIIQLYDRLIPRLDEGQAEQLRRERKSLELEIQRRSNAQP